MMNTLDILYQYFHNIIFSAKKYYNRLIQLGNNPKIFLVGGLGAANIKKIKFLSKKNLKKN